MRLAPLLIALCLVPSLARADDEDAQLDDWRPACGKRFEAARVALAKAEPTIYGSASVDVDDDGVKLRVSFPSSVAGAPAIVHLARVMNLHGDNFDTPWKAAAERGGRSWTRARQSLGGIVSVGADETRGERFAVPMRRAVEQCLGAPPSPVEKSPFEGRFSIKGKVLDDPCGGRVMLATTRIEIDLARSFLTANVVNRRYTASVNAGTLTASGDFATPGPSCPKTGIRESWTLHLGEGGALDGELTSSWFLPPACFTQCSMRFAIHAVPDPAH